MKIYLTAVLVLSVSSVFAATTIVANNDTQCLCTVKPSPWSVSCQKVAQRAVYAGTFDSQYRFLNAVKISQGTVVPVINDGQYGPSVLLAYSSSEYADTVSTSLEDPNYAGIPASVDVIQVSPVNDTDAMAINSQWFNPEFCTYTGPTNPPLFVKK